MFLLLGLSSQNIQRKCTIVVTAPCSSKYHQFIIDVSFYNVKFFPEAGAWKILRNFWSFAAMEYVPSSWEAEQ